MSFSHSCWKKVQSASCCKKINLPSHGSMKKTCDLLDIDSCKFSLFASAEDVLSCNSNRWVSYCRHMDRRKVHHVASARRRKSLTSRRKANRVQLSHLQGSYMIRVLQTSRIGNIESNLCGDKWRRMVNFKPVTYNCYILRISLTSTLDPIRGQRFQQLRHQPFCRYRQEFYRKKKNVSFRRSGKILRRIQYTDFPGCAAVPNLTLK